MVSIRSLFARLLVAQVVLTILLTAILAVVFYVDRNRTVAQLVTLIAALGSRRTDYTGASACPRAATHFGPAT
jgi:hypothetical protein